MSYTSLSLLLSCILNFGIGLYVLVHNPHRLQNRSFAFFSACVGGWSLAVIASTEPSEPQLLAFQFAFAIASLIPVSLCITLEAIWRGEPIALSRPTKALAVGGAVLSVLSFSSYMVVSGAKVAGELKISYGFLHSVFFLYIVSAFGMAGRTLRQAYRATEGQVRLQFAFLSVGLLVPALLAITTNVFVPYVFGTSWTAAYGPLASLLMLVMIAHAIIRHRLMDIRVVIKRSVVYAAACLLSGILLVSLILSANAVLHDGHEIPLRDIGLALLVGVLFFPLKGRIQRTFDTYLYRQPYDYRRTIQQASRALNGTIHLPTLLGHVHAVVGETLRPEGQAIFLLDEEENLFQRASTWGEQAFPASIATGAPLLERAARVGAPIFRDELTSEEIALAAEYAHLGIEVVVPFIEDNRLIGFLAVGQKRSGDPFFSDDADLLGTLAHQSSVAIRNAQAHRLVLEANEYIQKVLATIESGVISVNARGRVKVFNRAAEAMTGTGADTLCGHPVAHLPGPLARLVQSTLDDSQPRSQAELTLPDAAGQLIPLMCSTSPLLDRDGSLVGAVAVFSDLSRLKELELEKRRAERLAALEAIASGMAHEIRNPLVAIKTFLQLLPTRYTDAGYRENLMRVTDRDITRIEELLDRFRTLASASSQRMEPVDVSVALDHTFDLLRAQMEERGIRLRYVADGAPRRVLGNASQLEQLFSNLCLNAIEAMELGGELTVRLADLSEGGGTTLLVEVSDTGTGVADDVLPSIFNPFVTTKPRGSGLGLAICRSVADAHHAKLAARNNTERPGATFTVEFPVVTKEPARTSL